MKDSSSNARIVDDLGAAYVFHAADERLGDDFIEYLARRLGVGPAVASQVLSDWLHQNAAANRPGLCKTTSTEAAPTDVFAASPHALR
jgi:hypothetical protein